MSVTVVRASPLRIAVRLPFSKGDPGPQGEQGEPGLSAYEVAVTEGFIGDEAAWLDSLVGPEGPEGPQGATGDAGETGATGAEGPEGPEGPQGPQGDPGVVAATAPVTYNGGTQTVALSIGGGLEESGGSLRRQALTGDVTAAAGSNSTTIANDAVTTAKILNANVTLAKIANIASARVLGRTSASSGVVEELTVAQVLAMLGLFAPSFAEVNVSTTLNNDTHLIPEFTVVADPDGYHSVVASKSRYTIPAGKGGRFNLGVFLTLAGPTTNDGALYVSIHKNGVGILSANRQQTIVWETAYGTQDMLLFPIVAAAAGDYLEVDFYQDSGENLALTATFMLQKVA